MYAAMATDSTPPRGSVCLTLDVEADYGRTATVGILNRVGSCFDWIRAENVPVTAFVTGRILEQGHPILDRLAAAGASVELHGYAHDAAEFGTMFASHAEEIERGTAAHVRRLGRPPVGYRAPAGVIGAGDLRLLDRLGYRYDSSVFPVRRPHRYDFSSLPRRPFRWAGLRLVEFPVGLLTPRLPASLTFTSLLGPMLSAGLATRALRRLGTTDGTVAPFIIDGHFHNLYADSDALATLPARLSLIYRLGQWSGGLASLRSLVATLRRRGYALASLTDLALRPPPVPWPETDLGVFAPTGRP